MGINELVTGGASKLKNPYLNNLKDMNPNEQSYEMRTLKAGHRQAERKGKEVVRLCERKFYCGKTQRRTHLGQGRLGKKLK